MIDFDDPSKTSKLEVLVCPISIEAYHDYSIYTDK